MLQAPIPEQRSSPDVVLQTRGILTRAHYTEQAFRLIVGGALVSFAPSMWYPNLFKLFGC